MHLGAATGKAMTMPSGTVRSILSSKGGDVFAVSPADTVLEAIAIMNEKRVGALLVMEAGQLVGIISERDYARKVILMGRSSKDTNVDEIMSAPVIVVNPETPLEECMRIVTEHRIRHLPVVDRDRVIGVVSIGDLVRSIIAAQADTIDHLHNYINSAYPA